MAGLILDSSVAIKAEREKLTIAELLKSIQTHTDSDQVGLSSIGVTELFDGIYRADSPMRAERRRVFLEALLHRLPVFAYMLKIAQVAGRIDGEETRIGHNIPFSDLLIGATALFHGYFVLTVNVRHFRMIPGLEVIAF